MKDKTENIKASDSLDLLVFEQGIRTIDVFFNFEVNLIIVLLNKKRLIKRPLSEFNKSQKASKSDLFNNETDGIDIHWPKVDEDLSLRGFLKYDLLQQYRKKTA